MIRAAWASALLIALAPGAAHAFDCAQAKSKIEKGVCASPRVKALDDQLNAAYRASQSGARDDAQSVRRAQKGWLATRDRCAARADLEDCLVKIYEPRVRELQAQVKSADASPHPAWFESKSVHRKKPYEYDLDYVLVRKEKAPGAAKINAVILAAVKDSTCESPGEKPDPDFSSHLEVKGAVVAAGKFLAISQAGDSFCGGAHPNTYSTSDLFRSSNGEKAVLDGKDAKPDALLAYRRKIVDMKDECGIEEWEKERNFAFRFELSAKGVELLPDVSWPHAMAPCETSLRIPISFREAAALFRAGTPSANLLDELK